MMKKLKKFFKNYDLFIFDKIKTSALHFALSKKLPTIIIPLGENNWICKKKKNFILIIMLLIIVAQEVVV